MPSRACPSSPPQAGLRTKPDSSAPSKLACRRGHPCREVQALRVFAGSLPSTPISLMRGQAAVTPPVRGLRTSCNLRAARVSFGRAMACPPCAGQTGKLKGMKKSNSEEVANRTGSEPCVVVRKGEGEASAGVRAGWVLSREIHDLMREPWGLLGADAVEVGGRQHRTCRYREARPDLARSETPSTHEINLCGNREIPLSSGVERTADRIVKPLANYDDERRREVGQLRHAPRVRHRAPARGAAYLAIKRDAAAGIDGETWRSGFHDQPTADQRAP